MSASADTERVVELTGRLIAAPSPNPPGDEIAVAAVLREALAEAGLPEPRLIARDDARPNLLTTIDFGPGGRHLALCGHMDTKPVGDAAWSVDPFRATVDGDRLHGLGSADMKGALAAMVLAAARLAAEPPTAGRLSLAFVADEEDGAAFGAQHLVASGELDADGVVIGEAAGIEADFDRLHLAGRGIARARVVARATQGHSSLADELGARNAGVDVARAVVALGDGEPPAAPPAPAGIAGWNVTLNAGLAYRGGVGYGVLPEAVAADCEVRLLPGMDRDAVTATLTERLAEARDGGAELALEWSEPPTDWLEGTLVDPADPLAEAARAALARILGSTPPDSVFPGTTDATFLGADGTPVLPAVGPGLLRRAHAADEWVSIAALRRAVDLYAEITTEYCPG
ncbi:MAG TPA: M20 family metallopeptidase [Solirubrobacterales bacterium]|nr:M20 family metallopeptidase [Solirubrobacterales bacterium]